MKQRVFCHFDYNLQFQNIISGSLENIFFLKRFRTTATGLVCIKRLYLKRCPTSRTIYELQLTYNFNIAKATEITPNFPLLSDVLYESEFESQLWMLYNSHKQLVSSGDAYPSKWFAKVLLQKIPFRCCRPTPQDLIRANTITF